jgi:hypothetical protein
MKTAFAIVIMSCAAVNAWAQAGNSRGDMDIIFNDLNKKYSYDKRYSTVEGTPYLFNDWTAGSLKMPDGRMLTNVQMNIDLVTQNLIVQNSQKVAMVVSHDQFSTLNFNNAMVFKLGFPTIDNQTPASLYQVLIEDKVSLLKYSQKSIVQLDEFDRKKKFMLYEDYYFLYDNAMNGVKSKTLSKVFPGMKDEIVAYIKTEGLKMKDEGDVKKLIQFVNSKL